MITGKEKLLLEALKRVRPMQIWSYDNGVFTLNTGSQEHLFSADKVSVMLEADAIEFERKVALIRDALRSKREAAS